MKKKKSEHSHAISGGSLDSTQMLWPWVVYALLVFVTVAGMLGLSSVLGQRHREAHTGDPYESGMSPTGSARLRFSVDFYIVALLFILFDLASVFIITWAIGAKLLGWAGFTYIAVVIGIMSAALLYFWRCGVFDLYQSEYRSGGQSQEPSSTLKLFISSDLSEGKRE